MCTGYSKQAFLNSIGLKKRSYVIFLASCVLLLLYVHDARVGMCVAQCACRIQMGTLWP